MSSKPQREGAVEAPASVPCRGIMLVGGMLHIIPSVEGKTWSNVLNAGASSAIENVPMCGALAKHVGRRYEGLSETGYCCEGKRRLDTIEMQG